MATNPIADLAQEVAELVDTNAELVQTVQENLELVQGYADDAAASAAEAATVIGSLLPTDGATKVGTAANNVAAVAQTVADKIFIRKDLFDFIPVNQRAAITSGTSSYDATAAVVAAFNWANGFLRDGASSSFKLPGACLNINPGKYVLSSLAASIAVKCNLISEGAEFVVPASFATEVFRLGMDTAGVNLSMAKIEMPNISKIHVDAVPTAGSVGIRLCNINASDIKLGRTTHMESGWWFGGIGEGTVYNKISLGQILYCKRSMVFQPGTGGWVNSNAFYGGNLAQSPGFAGGGIRRSGWRHLLMDGRSPSTSIVGNVFFGTAFEGNSSEYMFEVWNSYENTWIGCYHETGAPSESVTVSGDTITQTGHGKSVGDALVFNASVAPTGMQVGVIYYIVEIPTSDTFKVSLNKAGTAVTFSSAGTSVNYKLCMRLLFSQSGNDNNYSNRLINTFVPPSIALDIIETGTAYNNGETRAIKEFKSVFDTVDLPQWRGQNKSGSALRRPIFAAYPTTAHPILQPELWTCAISDRGIFYKSAAGGEIGHLTVSAGVLKYRANAEATSYDIASSIRSQSALAVTALSVPANGQATTTFTLSGAANMDYATVCPTSALPNGISIAWARVSATDTVQVCFTNYTAAPISLTANFYVKVDRRFF